MASVTIAALAQGDAQNLPFAGNSFDAVVSCETIEHLPKLQDALCELHRVTRPGGKLFLTMPNYANFMGLYDLYVRARHPARQDDQPFDRRQWFPQVHRWLRKAGWKILRTDGTVCRFPSGPATILSVGILSNPAPPSAAFLVRSHILIF